MLQDVDTLHIYCGLGVCLEEKRGTLPDWLAGVLAFAGHRHDRHSPGRP